MLLLLFALLFLRGKRGAAERDLSMRLITYISGGGWPRASSSAVEETKDSLSEGNFQCICILDENGGLKLTSVIIESLFD
jgi:hypothetical protein